MGLINPPSKLEFIAKAREGPWENEREPWD
jgi:hypothetical protein